MWKDERTIAWDKQTVAHKALMEAEGSGQKSVRTQTMLDWNAILLYKGPSENEHLISKKYLLKI